MQHLKTQNKLASVLLGKRRFVQVEDEGEHSQPSYMMKASKSLESNASLSTECSDCETSHNNESIFNYSQKESISQNQNQGFTEILSKSKQLASIFKGEVKTVDAFSISKGNHSIRFSCQNEHNFFISADIIEKVDIQRVKRSYKQSRIALERIHEGSQEVSADEAGSERKPLVNLDIDPSCWCPHCYGYFQHCLEVYNTDTFQLVGGLFTKYILYRCKSKGHMFPVKSLRKQKFHKQYKVEAYKCHDCVKDQKLEQKRIFEEEQERLREQVAEQQRILFEQIAAEEREQERLHDTYFHQQQDSYQNQPNKPQVSSHLYAQEQQINQRSQEFATKFLKTIESLQTTNISKEDQLRIIREIGITAVDNSNLEYYMKKLNDLAFDHVYLVHKFLETPLNVIVSGLANKSEEDVRNYYKQVAKLIHPDKNVHPKSKDAFQKLRTAVDQCQKLK